MKISVTINLGNYENLKIETNEHEDWDKCVKELMFMLGDIPNREVKQFYHRLVDPDLLTKEHPLVKKWKEIAKSQKQSDIK